MRLLIQRVSQAEVTVQSEVVGSIGKGLLVFLGIHKNDDESKIPFLVQKLVHLRIFSDAAGKMNLSLLDMQGEVLLVSQFTLYGNCMEGRRPDFFSAAPPDRAKELYEVFIEQVKKEAGKVATGVFGAEMQVHLVNDGPVTFIVEN